MSCWFSENLNSEVAQMYFYVLMREIGASLVLFLIFCESVLLLFNKPTTHTSPGWGSTRLRMIGRDMSRGWLDITLSSVDRKTLHLTKHYFLCTFCWCVIMFSNLLKIEPHLTDCTFKAGTMRSLNQNHRPPCLNLEISVSTGKKSSGHLVGYLVFMSMDSRTNKFSWWKNTKHLQNLAV